MKDRRGLIGFLLGLVSGGALAQTSGPVKRAAAGGGGTPGGSSFDIQYNNAGAFAGDANLQWIAANQAVQLKGRVTFQSFTNSVPINGDLWWDGTLFSAYTNGIKVFQLSDTTVGIGGHALQNLTSGANNVGVGFDALFAVTGGAGNLAFGADAINAVTTGSGNVGIGSSSGFSQITKSNGIFIGNNSDIGADQDNALAIGDNTNGIRGNWSSGPITCTVPWKFAAIQKSGLPANTDIAAGLAAVFKDTSGGGVYLAYNDAGTIKKVQLV